MARASRTDAFVMLITVIIVLYTHNLAVGVVAGVLFSAIFFATKISKVDVTEEILRDRNVLRFEGQIFFASIDTMMEQIEFKKYDSDIELDFSSAHLTSGMIQWKKAYKACMRLYKLFNYSRLCGHVIKMTQPLI